MVGIMITVIFLIFGVVYILGYFSTVIVGLVGVFTTIFIDGFREIVDKIIAFFQ